MMATIGFTVRTRFQRSGNEWQVIRLRSSRGNLFRHHADARFAAVSV